jgi:Animal haem peroxidase
MFSFSSLVEVPRGALSGSRLGRGAASLGLGALLATTSTLGSVSAQQAPTLKSAAPSTGTVSPRTASLLGCAQAPAKFGRLFPNLPAATWPAADVHTLATRVIAAEETNPTPENQVDDEENLAIDAGYTYVGQFIDHDLTLDPRPNDLTTPIDPNTLQDFRTPAFDLDSVYGGGPAASPELYQADHVHMKLGGALTGSATDAHAVDLPRDANGQALLGDPRNDENRIVAQLHSIFLRFHNLIVDRTKRAHPDWSDSRLFEDARRQVRDYYQIAVFTDFLPTIISREALNGTGGAPGNRPGFPRLQFFDPCKLGMPVEFSVGAYRFGHSMVRAIYRLNTTLQPRLPVFTLTNDPTKDLGGFRPSPPNFAIDWSFFFLMAGQTRQVGKPQPSYKLDNSLVFPLSLLPVGDAGSGPTSLSERNLLRSEQLGLPSGQAVANAYGISPLRDDQILIGKATGVADDATGITAVASSFAGKAPLWTYVLAEATATAYNVHDGHIDGAQVAPMRLGPVGGRIVAETFGGLLLADSSSILYDSSFQPDPGLVGSGPVSFADIIHAVITN